MSTSAPSTCYDVLVVGAGVAGGALINRLARDGRRILCIERQLYDTNTSTLTEPQRIVGELLQPGGYAQLLALGLRDALEGIDAQPIYGYGIFLDGRSEKIDYVDEHDAAVGDEQGSSGRAFHNGRFLKKMRQIALAHPNITLVEGNVVALDKDDSGRVIGASYRDGAKQLHQVRAALTIACDGCASNLRKRTAPQAKVAVYSQFYGLLLKMTKLPFQAHGHVLLANPSPVLFYPVSSTEVRCLVDIPSSFTGDPIQHMLSVIAPQAPELFRGPFIKAVESGDVKMMHNRVMTAAPTVVPGALLLGDSFNMRHPLTGGGMTVALSDVRLICDLLKDIVDLQDHARVSQQLEIFYQRRKPMSTTINILANALYAVFCASEDPALEEMRIACFDYLGSGGRMTHDPMSMLGGLKPSPFLLVTHFFGVALYGCGRSLMPFPTPARISRSWSIFRAAFNIVKPLIDAERLWPISWLPISSL